MSWLWQVFTLELRKTFAYRADYWLNLVLTIFSELGIAFFLWRSIFRARGASEMGGFTFLALMFYYLLVALVGRTLRGTDRGFISDEIYQGTLTRYLVYPIPVFAYKFVLSLGKVAAALIQLVLGVALFLAVFGLPADSHPGAPGIGMGFAALLLGYVLFFVFTVALELVAFWQDSVWSLLVMLNLSGNFLSGALIPVAFYPPWLRGTMRWLPFRMWADVPVRAFMGRLSVAEWSREMAVAAAWTLLLSAILGWVWSRGTREYAGVGI